MYLSPSLAATSSGPIPQPEQISASRKYSALAKTVLVVAAIAAGILIWNGLQAEEPSNPQAGCFPQPGDIKTVCHDGNGLTFGANRDISWPEASDRFAAMRSDNQARAMNKANRAKLLAGIKDTTIADLEKDYKECHGFGKGIGCSGEDGATYYMDDLSNIKDYGRQKYQLESARVCGGISDTPYTVSNLEKELEKAEGPIAKLFKTYVFCGGGTESASYTSLVKKFYKD